MGFHQMSRKCLSFRSTWVHLGIKWGSCYWIFSFMCNVCRSPFCPFSFDHFVFCPSLRIQSTPLVSSNSSFDYERIWWRLFKVVRTTFDIYVFIIVVFVILNKWFYRFIFICMFYTRNIRNTVKVGGKISPIVLTG